LHLLVAQAEQLAVHGRGPLLREHNRYVYGELLGLSDEEMQALEAEKII